MLRYLDYFFRRCNINERSRINLNFFLEKWSDKLSKGRMRLKCIHPLKWVITIALCIFFEILMSNSSFHVCQMSIPKETKWDLCCYDVLWLLRRNYWSNAPVKGLTFKRSLTYISFRLHWELGRSRTLSISKARDTEKFDAQQKAE